MVTGLAGSSIKRQDYRQKSNSRCQKKESLSQNCLKGDVEEGEIIEAEVWARIDTANLSRQAISQRHGNRLLLLGLGLLKVGGAR
jgi:hypothetical protein